MPLQKFAKIDEYGDSQLQDKWQTVLDGFPPEEITAAKISEALDENPEDRAKQIRVKGKTYQLLVQKALAAGMTVSEYLEILIGGTEPPENEPDEEGAELTPEQEEILKQAEACFNKPKSGGFAIKMPSKCHQKAIKPNRSDKASDSS